MNAAVLLHEKENQDAAWPPSPSDATLPFFTAVIAAKRWERALDKSLSHLDPGPQPMNKISSMPLLPIRAPVVGPLPAMTKAESIASLTSCVTVSSSLSARGADEEEEDGDTEESRRCSRRCMIHPDSPSKQVWDMFVACALFYTIVVLPIRIAFEPGGWVIIPGTVIDFVFMADVIITFRTARVRSYSEQRVFIWNPKLVARKYLLGWLSVDILSSIPVDLIATVATGDSALTSQERSLLRIPKLLRLLRIAKLVHLIRVLKHSSFYRYIRARTHTNSSFARLAALFVTSAVLAHYIACGWYLVGTAAPPGWMAHKYGNASVANQYLASYYWATYTITTVGFGDIKPAHPNEVMFVIFAMLIGVTFYAYVVGTMTFLVQRIGTDHTRDRLDEVNRYMSFRHFPTTLKVRMREHYLRAWSRFYHSRAELAVMQELTPALRSTVAQFLRHNVLRDSPLFEGGSAELITEIVLRLQPTFFAAGDVIVQEGDVGHEMFLLSEGVVEVGNHDMSLIFATLSEGAFFGEVALLTEGAVRMASVRAHTSCHVDLLNREDFYAVMALFPGAKENLGIFATARTRVKETEDERAKSGQSSRRLSSVSQPEFIKDFPPENPSPRERRQAPSSCATAVKKRRCFVSLGNEEDLRVVAVAMHCSYSELVSLLARTLEVDADLISTIFTKRGEHILRDGHVRLLENNTVLEVELLLPALEHLG